MKFVDIFYWYLALAHRSMLKVELKKEDRAFIDTNINKHRLIQWLNLFAAGLVFISLRKISHDQLGTVIMALIAPVTVMGGAWFAMSFGAIPKNLISCSMEVTFWMYLSFKICLTTMLMAIAFITPWTIWPVLALIYVATDFSCIPYDTADGLKAGLDAAILKHSRLAVKHYLEMGLGTEEEP